MNDKVALLTICDIYVVCCIIKLYIYIALLYTQCMIIHLKRALSCSEFLVSVCGYTYCELF